jgi:multidrug efflux system outer membrane protein
MKLVTICTCFALAAALLAGCSSSTINRRDESERFRAEMNARVSALKIDPTKPLAMERCVEIALANNLDQKIRSLRESLQDEQVRLAMVGFLPKGSATYTQTHRSNPALTDFGGVTMELEDRSIKGFTAQFIMPVFDWGATYFAYTIAKDRQRQERLMVERATQTLVRDVRLAYNRLASAQRQEKLARIAPLAAKELLKVAQSLEREGLGSRASTTEVEAMLAQAALQWSMLRRQVEQTRMTLSQTMSLPAGLDFAIDDRLPQAPPIIEEKEIAALEESALRNRPELRAQDMERRIAANTLRKEFAQFLPRFDGLATYNWTSAASAIWKPKRQ